MIFTANASAFVNSNEPVQLCQSLVQIIENVDDSVQIDACISTFFIREGNNDFQAVPYSTQRDDSQAMNNIRNATKPISDAMKALGKLPVDVQFGAFTAYFSANAAQPIAQDELDFARENGFSKEKAWYLAIPFPSGDNPSGVFFLFIRNEQDLRFICRNLDQIEADIKNLFNK